MEETNDSLLRTQTPNPPTGRRESPPPPPASAIPPLAATAPPPATGPALVTPPSRRKNITGKKRKLEDGELQNSAYFQIRAILRDLRPSFVEVLRAPNLQDCQEANDILRKLNLMIELCKQPTGIISPTKHKKPNKGQCFAGEHKEPVEKHRGEKQVKQPQFDSTQSVPDNLKEGAAQPFNVPSFSDHVFKVLNSSEQVPGKAPEEKLSKAKNLKMQLQGLLGTYIVGGSPMGWNFLVYPGGKPVYYGVSKVAARSSRPIRPRSP